MSEQTFPARIVLRPRRAKPFFMRHPWVFSGAVERVEGPAEKGGVVAVMDSDGRFIGAGLFNPDSQIIVRLFTWDVKEKMDDAFWRRRVEAAIALRHDVLRLPAQTDAYRVIYSESDGLPGLIVDRYGDYLCAQFQTAGMAARREKLLDLLEEHFSPRGILARGDEETAEKELVTIPGGALRGTAPEGPVEISMDGLRFQVDIAGGQKTGFFLDQRDNRLAAARYMKDRRVLDLFCYTGAFAVTAMKLGGAKEALALDRSASALAMARTNAELNGVNGIEYREGQVSDELRSLKKEGRKFDAVILDPPKFARSRPGVERALRAYRDANLLSMQLLDEGGILVTCSCSGHVSPDDFLAMLNDAAVEASRSVQVLERRGQSPDHPVIASCPETGYLKCLICRVGK